MNGGAPNAGAMFDLAGRVAVVTGASSGLGRRFALTLDSVGAHVVAVARRDELLRDLADASARIVPVTADVTSSADRERVVATTLERYDRIDVLVNNAGGGGSQPAFDETVEEFAATLELNLVSVFALSTAVARHMVDAGRGSIVNIASIYGLVAAAPIPYAGYAASKGGVVNLTRELACQWARRGVRVNALAPGFFPTDMNAAAREDEGFLSYLRRNCPMGRFAEPDELDGALLFLASDASTYVTGQTLAVDGGWTAR
jgi:NAD(P)-dependent dehydrogenase (short-subunit alcohol dehydrogenase family)